MLDGIAEQIRANCVQIVGTEKGTWKTLQYSKIHTGFRIRFHLLGGPAEEIQKKRAHHACGVSRATSESFESACCSVLPTARAGAATLSLSQPECHMPPRTRVHCPGCPHTFDSESSLRRHRAHRAAVGTSCQLEFRQAGRVSSWAPGPAGGPARFHVVDMDLYGYQERSPTPDPGDDLNPPPGFDEDDLGGPAPPPPALAPPAPPAQVSFNHRTHTIHINTYEYTRIHTIKAQYRQCCRAKLRGLPVWPRQR